MLQSPVLSKASEAVRSKLDRTNQESDTSDSSSDSEDREPEAEQATCRCPNCEEMTDIEGTYLLAPNEKHIEPCSNCGKNISMEYDDTGEWTIEMVNKKDTNSSDDLSTLRFT